MRSATSKRLEWSPRALASYLASLARIAAESEHTAQLVRERVERALELIRAHPGLGTLGQRAGYRVFPIPGTGHVIQYRVTRYAIRVRVWYRARQRIGF